LRCCGAVPIRKMSRALALTALTVALLLCVAAAMPAPPKRQRNGAKGKPERKSRDSKGDEVTCEACKAIAVEVGPKVESLVKKLGRENAVTEVLDSFCDDFSNFNTYNQIPPKMQEGCRRVMGRSAEAFERLFYEGVDGRAVWDKVCSKRYCGGRIPFDQQRTGPSVVMDGDKAEL